ncbi:MAG: DGQHR domain-containing protein [Cyanobacteria bacterium SBLK]|nr:DGQHR domain-containing protein [Cyanobacteria bacterium SBLK]
MNDTDRQTLSQLLDRCLDQSDRLLVQKTKMGNTEAYLGTVTLQWLSDRVQFAAQLPLFRQKIDPENLAIVPDADTAENLQQRPLDWSRQAPLAQYLATRKTHKFPALLVVLNPLWIDDPKAPQWDKKGRAKETAAPFDPLDRNHSLGLLTLDRDMQIFALDGQHRLMGIQGLMELIKTGRLEKYKKSKKTTGTAIAVDDPYQDLDRAYLQTLPQETIALEFIPAVIQGETREEARRRIRSIFVHVNLTAVRLSKGQLALLNEDDGFSLVARRVALKHPLFKKQQKSLINWNSATVAAKSIVLTTLQALQDMARAYLRHPFPHWQPADIGLLPLRPEDEELADGENELKILFNYLAKLPSYQRMKRKETPDLRRFHHDTGGGEGNMLFRPVGQIALVGAIGILVYQHRINLHDIFLKLSQYDAEEGFSKIDFPASIWYGVLYDPLKKRIQVSGKDLATKLTIYLVAGEKDEFELIKLRTAFAKARTVNEDKAIALSGKWVNPKAIELPPVL